MKPFLPSSFIFFCGLLLTAAPAGAQTREQRAGARAAAEAGGDAFDAGKYADAADLFDRAERLVHAPPHLLYGARANVKLGRLMEARELYLALTKEKLADSSPRAFRDAQSMGEKELNEIEPRVPSVSVVVQGGGAAASVRVTRNGTAVPAELVGIPTPVNPGEYSYQAFAEGMESNATTVKIKEGGRETVVLTLRPIPGYVKKDPNEAAGPTAGKEPASGGARTSLNDPPPSDSGGSRPYFIASMASFGVGAVGVGLGTYFLLAFKDPSDKSDAIYNVCLPRDGGCTDLEKKQIHDYDNDAAGKRNLAIASYIVGGVGIGAGITLLVMDSNRSSATAQRRITPIVGLNYVGLNGTF